MNATKTYTVVGFNGETRFADFYQGETPKEAEEFAVEDHPDLRVCATFEGEIFPES